MDESECMQPGLLTTRLKVAEFLRTCSLFATLTDRELEQVAALCRQDSYQPQQVIFHQGEPSESLYIVVEGAVALVRHCDDRQGGGGITLTSLIVTSGGTFGWLSLVKPSVIINSAQCLRPTTVLVIDGARLRFLMEKSYRVGFEVMDSLAKLVRDRIKATFQLLESKMQSEESDDYVATTNDVNQKRAELS